MDNYGKLYKEHTAVLKHREWRGFKDTMYDYYRWLVTWKDMIKMVLKAPISTVKGIWRYRWMASYLSAPSFIDRHVAGLRGPQLRMAHLHYNMIVKTINFSVKKLIFAESTFSIFSILAASFAAQFGQSSPVIVYLNFI